MSYQPSEPLGEEKPGEANRQGQDADCGEVSLSADGVMDEDGLHEEQELPGNRCTRFFSSFCGESTESDYTRTVGPESEPEEDGEDFECGTCTLS